MKDINNEIWIEIEGYEKNYEVSNLGNIRRKYSKKTKSLQKKNRDKKDYYTGVCLYQNEKIENKLVHRLVAQAFIPNPENKPCVNHINSIKHDNRVENLEWCTSRENKIHSIDSGTTKNKGIDNGFSKITDIIVLDIRKHKEKPLSFFSKKYNINKSTVWLVKKGKTWKHLPL